MKQSPQTIKALIIAVIIAAAVSAIGILAVDGMGKGAGKVFIICLCFILFALFGAAPLVVAEKPAYKTLGIAGMIVPVLGFVLTAVAILGEIGDVGLMKFIGCLFVLSLGLAQVSLLYHINVQNNYANTARIAATVGIAIFTFLIIIRIFDSFLMYESFLYDQSTSKITVVAFIVDLAATILVPLCNRLPVIEKIEMDFEQTPPAADQSDKQDPAV